MSAALGGHLSDAYKSTHGATSLHPALHGVPFSQQSQTAFGSPAFFMTETISEETAKKIAALQVKLNRKLGPEYISQRPGPGGGPKLTYVEGWKVINLANEVFGFNGWSSSVVSLTIDFTDYIEETKRYCVGVTAIVRVTLRDGAFHEDIGYGMLENSKSKGAALDKSKKEAVTDGLKRALRNFGNLLGNCLYDKRYTAEIVKVKVDPPKFNKDELHRRPEFEDVKPNVSTASVPAHPKPPLSKPPRANPNYVTPTRAPVQNQAPPPNPIQQGTTVSSSTSAAANNRGIPPQHPVQMITPVTTPLHKPQPERQPQPQHEKRVSFVNPAAPSSVLGTNSSVMLKQETDFGSDDTYGFNDAEFLALADFEADIGRPIGESDLGRPIDHEEGTLPNGSNEEQGLSHNPVPHPKTRTNVQKSLSREAAIAAALQAHAEESSTSSSKPAATKASTVASVSTVSTHAPTTVASSATTSKGSSDPSRTGPPPPEQINQTLSSARYQRYLQVRERQQNQNLPSEQPKSDQKAQSVPVPPMGGGFNFPPGMSMVSPMVIGVKRPAESMSTVSSISAAGGHMSFKGGRPGMGLQPPRQILGALEVGEGGDVKRLKR